MSSTESKLAEVIQRVFRVTLTDPGADGAAGGDLLYLESLAIELVTEGAEPPFLVTEPLLERALIARLSLTTDALPPRWRSDPETAPFPWLLASFARCDAESRKTRSRDEAFAAAFAACLRQCFEYCVSYSGLLLNPAMAGMFPQPPAFESRGPLQLFDAMAGAGAFQPITGAGGLPSGFLESFGARFENEGLEDILGPVLAHLPSLIKGVSPLGETHGPLSLLCQIAASKPCAAAMARHERWRPTKASVGGRNDGRRFEDESILGPFFQCAALPDDNSSTSVGPNGAPLRAPGGDRRPLEPDVRQQCFADLDRRRAGELEASYGAIRGVSKTVREGLYQALYVMLRHGGDVRESVVQWLASVCDANVGRSKMQIDADACASHGGALNVSSVAARLASPFADPAAGKFVKIDPDYVRSRRCRLDMSEVTRVALTDAEARTNALTEAEEAVRAAEPYGFICECFFLTARAMHLGYVKCAAEHTALAREVQDRARQMEDVDQMRDSWAASIPGGPSQFQMSQFERRVAEMKGELERAKSDYAMFDATLLDPEILGESARFYRLVAAWLRWVAEGRGNASGDPGRKATRIGSGGPSSGGGGGGDDGASAEHSGSLLPAPPPVSFAAIPEHIVDDLAEFLLYVQRLARRGPSRSAIDAELSHCLDDFVNLFVLMLGSPQYVKNPYLRAKFVEILRGWLPGDPADSRYEYVPRYASLFEGGNALATRFLVPSLLRLYVDIEFTGAANQFYDKFNIRHQIGEMCEYLWRLDDHRAAWSALATHDAAFYVRFLNMLINDAIWLLDESMKKLPELREHAAETADAQAWASRPARERQEREAANRQNERALRSDLTLAKVHVGMMGYTSRDIASPFLRPEMVERVAAMLNYFLLYLAGPERKQLKFADREKMKALAWDPPEMLGMIVDVYLHLFAADAGGAFVAAVAADGRAYRDEVFVETGAILRQLGTKSEADIAAFEALAERARLTHAAAEEEEADLGDVPDAFLDPIMCTLMTDPVLLPSGDTMDRANITRHLLTDETNPFTRQPLKASDLVPNEALKAEIETWVSERKRGAHASRGG